jgi:hypothetical protein
MILGKFCKRTTCHFILSLNRRGVDSHDKHVHCADTLTNKKGSAVLVTPSLAEYGKGSDHFGSYVRSLPFISTRGCFQDLNP